MKYDTVLFLRTPGQELLHSIIRFLYLKEAIFTKEELCRLIYFTYHFIARKTLTYVTHTDIPVQIARYVIFCGFVLSGDSNYLLVTL